MIKSLKLKKTESAKSEEKIEVFPIINYAPCQIYLINFNQNLNKSLNVIIK